MSRAVVADLTWTDDGFRPGLAVALSDDGRIAGVAPADELPADADVRHLPRRALLPGFVDAHSHAFQRGLRGRGETFPTGDGDDVPDSFWGWRRAMYRLVESLDPDAVHRLSLRAFREMRRAGITTVGEFHYLRHHRLDDGGDFAHDAAVVAAARDAGLRLVLLVAYYQTGGIGAPLSGGQRHFATPDLAGYWRQMDRLEALLDPATQGLGVVAHSLRAVPLTELAELHAEARRRGHVVHLHVEEQRQEIADCLEAYGAPPMRVLLDGLEIGPRVTAVHCTHTRTADLAAFQRAGGTVCICPTTEGNLGDGIADLPTILAAGGHLALGTDSNARISMLEEMRWLEYVQRLRRERRGVVVDAQGRLGARLLAAATAGGARSLGLAAGAIAPGHHADLVAIDLDHPSLAGLDADTLLDGLVLGAGDDALAEVMVGGRWDLEPAR